MDQLRACGNPPGSETGHELDSGSPIGGEMGAKTERRPVTLQALVEDAEGVLLDGMTPAEQREFFDNLLKAGRLDMATAIVRALQGKKNGLHKPAVDPGIQAQILEVSAML